MTAKQIDTADLIAAHEAHLRQLYLSRAQLGIATPPHIHTEIARIETELDRLRPSPAPLDIMTVYRLLAADIMRLDAQIGSLRRLVENDLLARATGRAPRPSPRGRSTGGERGGG